MIARQKLFSGMLRVLVLSMVIAMASCTTIEINEKDVFDVKRTIDPEYFENTRYQLEEVHFISGRDIQLEAWFIDHPEAMGTVLYFGGNGFLMETSHWIIRSIVEQRMNLLVFNYRGYGSNPGQPTISGLKADAMAAYNYLTKEREIAPEEIIIHGHSMGTMLGSYVADKQPVGGLVLESPLTDVHYYTEQMVPSLLKPFIQFKIDSKLLADSNTERIARISAPLLIVVGKEDRITPPAMAQKLYKKAAAYYKTLKILEKGGHNDLAERDDYQSILHGFYNQTMNHQASRRVMKDRHQKLSGENGQ